MKYTIPRNGWFYKDGKFLTVKYSDGTTLSTMPSPFSTKKEIDKLDMLKDGEMISGQVCRIYFPCDFKMEIFDFGINNDNRFTKT